MQKINRYLPPLILFDVLGALLSFSFSYWLRISSGLIPYNAEASFAQYLELFIYSVPVLIIVFRAAGLYERHGPCRGSVEYIRLLKGTIFFIFGVIIVSYAAHGPPPSRGWLVATWLSSFTFIALNRIIFKIIMLRKKGRPMERVLVLGANEDSRRISEQLERDGMEVIGFLDDFNPKGGEVWKGKKVLGPPNSYRKIAKETGAKIAILVSEANSWETRRDVLSQFSIHDDVELQIAPSLSDLHLVSMRVGFRGNVPLLRFRPGYITGLDAVVKGFVDMLIGVFLLVATAPILLSVTIMLWLEDRRSVIESFEVLGRNGRPFRTYKFRTGMRSPASYRSFHKRISIECRGKAVGCLERLLLQTGLDKLPQLFNVLLCEMSIVGPRTIPPDSAGRCGQWLYSILAVRPGITGSWALHETKDLEHETSLTLHYVRNWSMWADLAIIGRTVFELFRTRFRSRLMSDKKVQW